MSGYEKLAREEDEAEEDEQLDTQIENLNKLKEYNFVFPKLEWLFCYSFRNFRLR